MPGMHGTYTAITALQRADLLIAIGVRFDDRVTGNPASFALGQGDPCRCRSGGDRRAPQTSPSWAMPGVSSSS